MSQSVMPGKGGGFDAGKGKQRGRSWPLIDTILSFTRQKDCSCMKILYKKSVW
jgi:hypothetical protein